jgi:hypothetical protein
MRTALLLSLLVATPPALALSSSPSAPANTNATAHVDAAAPVNANADATAAESPNKKSDEKAQGDEKSKKPSLSLRASPPISFSPANIHLVAELKGGPDDYEEFYCPAIEWDWGDGTHSENSSDCDPYEAGVSQIPRRFSKTHVYNLQGRYRVQVRLKRNTKVLTSASTNVQVRPGIRDVGPYEGDGGIDATAPAGPAVGGRRRP